MVLVASKINRNIIEANIIRRLISFICLQCHQQRFINSDAPGANLKIVGEEQILREATPRSIVVNL